MPSGDFPTAESVVGLRVLKEVRPSEIYLATKSAVKNQQRR